MYKILNLITAVQLLSIINQHGTTHTTIKYNVDDYAVEVFYSYHNDGRYCIYISLYYADIVDTAHYSYNDLNKVYQTYIFNKKINEL